MWEPKPAGLLKTSAKLQTPKNPDVKSVPLNYEITLCQSHELERIHWYRKLSKRRTLEIIILYHLTLHMVLGLIVFALCICHHVLLVTKLNCVGCGATQYK